MRIGFGAPVAGAWATPEYLAAFAERAEDAGYASLWTFQRLLVPDGSGMAPVYRSVLDPMVALGYAAARTSRIRLGVAVINMPFVSPAYLAKQATTVDVLSGGRLDLGLGLGWMPEEFVATGASAARRGARAEEYLAVLRALWAGGRYSGLARRSCSAACQARPCGGRGGSPRAGSPPASRTCPGSPRRSARSGRRRLRRGGTRTRYASSAGACGTGGVCGPEGGPQGGHPAVAPEGAAERAGEILAALAPR